MKRKMAPFAGLLDENFVWIGDYSSQYIQGKKAFLKTITEEINLPPLELSREEYRVLTHERHTWVTYGRCMVTTNMGTKDSLASGIHFTFVWKQLKNDMYLMLASATHVQDEQQLNLPAVETTAHSDKLVPQARVFYNVKMDEIFPKDTPKIKIRDLSGNLHFLFPDEIAYASSKGKDCTIHTVSGAELACSAMRQYLRRSKPDANHKYQDTPAPRRRKTYGKNYLNTNTKVIPSADFLANISPSIFRIISLQI